ncbi:glycosyltransferase family 4 protein [Miltoncostaea oceani]|uniref:glycosyltransferase family 4 protein n=1 Tax=Miltoncostaea oceani TaxID=2843216 RepID=UPI001C3E5777|nr:glycosyltransferase family 1 protein [Miltoncostaea oceani]
MTARRPRLWPLRRTRRSDHVATGQTPASSNGAAPEDRPLVLVDGRMARRRKTGIATYIHELQHVMENRPASDLRVEWIYGPPGLPRMGRLTSWGNLLIDMLWLHVLLPAAAARRRAAVLHAPVTWGPWWSPCPTVVTMHDLAWERVPEAFPENFRRYARLFARRSVKKAARVIAVSESTSRDLQELYRVPPERIRVVPNGVHPDTRPPGPREPFILSVGIREPRKRIAELVEGHAIYMANAPADPPPCRLVVVGGEGGDEERIRAAAGPGCEIRGFERREELLALYRRATLLAYPSAYEGFGLPVVEAMAHGCPVLCARNSSLIEIGGRSAIFLDDVTPEGIAAALTEALADREALAARGEAGRAEAARYSWSASATATRDVYRQALRR